MNVGEEIFIVSQVIVLRINCSQNYLETTRKSRERNRQSVQQIYSFAKYSVY